MSKTLVACAVLAAGTPIDGADGVYLELAKFGALAIVLAVMLIKDHITSEDMKKRLAASEKRWQVMDDRLLSLIEDSLTAQNAMVEVMKSNTEETKRTGSAMTRVAAELERRPCAAEQLAKLIRERE